MKIKLNVWAATLCGLLATAIASAQQTWIWTNSTVGDISVAANWVESVEGTNGIPLSANLDIMQFNGQSSGPVFATANIAPGTQSGGNGLYVHVTGNQANPVTLSTTVANMITPFTRMNAVTVDSGAGTFNLGHNSATNSLQIVWSAFNRLHTFLNESANTAIIHRNLAVRAGGAGLHTFIFAGTGNWWVTNDLIMNNVGGGSSSQVQVDGPGTLVWTAGNNPYSVGNAGLPISPFNINGGTAILKSPNLFVSTAAAVINNNGLLSWDLGAQTYTFAGTINGVGTLQVNSGTVTLGSGATGGQSTFTGNLVLSGGELIVNGIENEGVSGPLGLGGTISFSGGALGFSSVNTYDYSPRFSTDAGQAYAFHTEGHNVTFTNALTSSGGTLNKLGSGTLTLAGANTYSGLTTVSAGKLLLQNTAGSGPITVANSATLGVTGGSQITPSALTVGTTGSAALEFNNVSSTVTAPIAVAGAISVGGPTTVNINSGTFIVGQNYPLFSWGSGSAPAVNLGVVIGAVGTLSTNGNTIRFTPSALADKWIGGTDGNWDTTTAGNWLLNGSPVVFNNGDAALFDDTATGTTNVTVNAAVSPAGVTVNNNTLIYSIASSGANLIGGSGGLTKNGNSTLALSGGVNTYNGATTISAGTLIVGSLANGGSASDIGASANAAANLVLNGGTLQYTGGGATSDRLFTLSTAGGTIDNQGSGQLTLNNSGAVAMSGTGARTITLAGANTTGDTLAAVLGDNGGPTAITKNGAGTWILTGNSTNSGTVTINQGTLQVGAGGSGSLGSGNVTDQGALVFNIAGTVTNGVISGSGSVTLNGTGTVVLPDNNTYSGGTIINSGAKLQLGVGGATGSLRNNGAITNDGLLVFNTTGSFIYSEGINGLGNVIVRGVGNKISANGVNTYTGWTLIEPGATYQPVSGLAGAFPPSSFTTNNGTIEMPLQGGNEVNSTVVGPIVGTGRLMVDAATANANGTLTIAADCTYTGGTYIQQSAITVGDAGVNGSITGNVVFTNSAYGYEAVPRFLRFNRGDDITFAGNITGPGGTLVGGSVANSGIVVQDGFGTLTLTGTNNYLGGTTINAGTLRVGNGGTSGAIGTGDVTDNSILVWNRSDAVSFGGVISGFGSFVQDGPGTLTLTATNTYTGATTVSNGTLVVTGGAVGGELFLEGGTFVPASLSTGGELNVAGGVTINAGTILVPLNKSLSVTNLVVAGAISRNGGTLQLANVGPNLAVGDKFYIFSQPVSGFPTPIGAGATWQNDLDVDGSITALTVSPTVNTNPPVLQVSVSGSNLNLAWPTNAGWTLLTNRSGLSAANQWFPYPGSASLTNVSVAINPAATNVFFRMVYTNTP